MLIFEFETPRIPDYGIPLSFIPFYHVVAALVSFHIIAALPTTAANAPATAQSGKSKSAAADLVEGGLTELEVAELVWKLVLEAETVDTAQLSAIASSSSLNERQKKLPTRGRARRGSYRAQSRAQSVTGVGTAGTSAGIYR